MSRVRTRLEQYKTEIENKSQYKHGLPGSALDIVNSLLDDLEQDEKENGWIPVKYHQISEKERAEESISTDIQYMLDCKMPDDGQEMRLIDADKLKKDILLQNILGEPIQKIIDRYIHIVDKQPIIPMTVSEIHFLCYKNERAVRFDAIGKEDMGESCYRLEDIGRIVFLTREEAEKKLEEMKNDKT